MAKLEDCMGNQLINQSVNQSIFTPGPEGSNRSESKVHLVTSITDISEIPRNNRGLSNDTDNQSTGKIPTVIPTARRRVIPPSMETAIA